MFLKHRNKLLTHLVNVFLLPRVNDNSTVNNFTLVSFALLPYFDRDRIHSLRTARLIFK